MLYLLGLEKGGGSHSSFDRQEKNTVKLDSTLQRVCPLQPFFNWSVKCEKDWGEKKQECRSNIICMWDTVNVVLYRESGRGKTQSIDWKLKLDCSHSGKLYSAQSVGILATSVLHCSEKVKEMESKTEDIRIERNNK